MVLDAKNFITKNKVVWAPKWSKKQIAMGRAQEAKTRESYYSHIQQPVNAAGTRGASPLENIKPKENPWQKIKKCS